jgi:hypothetical protein
LDELLMLYGSIAEPCATVITVGGYAGVGANARTG